MHTCCMNTETSRKLLEMCDRGNKTFKSKEGERVSMF